MQTKDLDAYFDSLREDQLQHINYLAQFTTKALVNKEKYNPVVDNQFDFIKGNLNFLSMDEQVKFNDLAKENDQNLVKSTYLGLGVVSASFVLGLVRSSPTQPLRPYIMAGFGAGMAISTFKFFYSRRLMKENIDRIYFLIHLRSMRMTNPRRSQVSA